MGGWGGGRGGGGEGKGARADVGASVGLGSGCRCILRAGMKRVHEWPGRHTPLCVANQIQSTPHAPGRVQGPAQSAASHARAPGNPRGGAAAHREERRLCLQGRPAERQDAGGVKWKRGKGGRGKEPSATPASRARLSAPPPPLPPFPPPSGPPPSILTLPPPQVSRSFGDALLKKVRLRAPPPLLPPTSTRAFVFVRACVRVRAASSRVLCCPSGTFTPLPLHPRPLAGVKATTFLSFTTRHDNVWSPTNTRPDRRRGAAPNRT